MVVVDIFRVLPSRRLFMVTQQANHNSLNYSFFYRIDQPWEWENTMICDAEICCLVHFMQENQSVKSKDAVFVHFFVFT